MARWVSEMVVEGGPLLGRELEPAEDPNKGKWVELWTTKKAD